jgi:hypothetical protein
VAWLVILAAKHSRQAEHLDALLPRALPVAPLDLKVRKSADIYASMDNDRVPDPCRNLNLLPHPLTIQPCGSRSCTYTTCKFLAYLKHKELRVTAAGPLHNPLYRPAGARYGTRPPSAPADDCQRRCIYIYIYSLWYYKVKRACKLQAPRQHKRFAEAQMCTFASAEAPGTRHAALGDTIGSC